MSAPFAETLHQKIAAAGTISLADYMEMCAQHYYATRDPFGTQGDFTTAPEISQMFGELIALWLAQQWMADKKPSLLVELGAGRGTLTSDILRAGKIVDGFIEAQQVFLVEQSDYLKAIQKNNVPTANFVARFEDIPDDRPLYLIANEFFDALPIHQFEMTPAGWRERHITLCDHRLGWTLREGDIAALPDAEIGTIAETCPQAERLVAAIAHRIKHHGGAALVIDYGADTPFFGDSLQAVRRHQFHPVLEMAGEADITAHLRFEPLIEVARQQRVSVPELMTQKEFLEGLGIRTRAAALCAQADSSEQQNIASALKRLTAPAQMGGLFKVMMLLPQA